MFSIEAIEEDDVDDVVFFNKYMFYFHFKYI